MIHKNFGLLAYAVEHSAIICTISTKKKYIFIIITIISYDKWETRFTTINL